MIQRTVLQSENRCFYPQPHFQIQIISDYGQVCQPQLPCIPIDQSSLHTHVNINISCLRMFLKCHGLLKHSRNCLDFSLISHLAVGNMN